MRWITNMRDTADAIQQINVPKMPGETHERARERYRSWLKGKIIGEPMGSDRWTVQQLKDMGFVGVYVPEGNELALSDIERITKGVLASYYSLGDADDDERAAASGGES